MGDEQCPVCKSDVSPTGGPQGGAHGTLGKPRDQQTECPSCGAKLERLEGDAWVLQGDAPAG